MTDDALRTAIERLGDPQQRLYFFEKLRNPALFEQLKAMRLFEEPPAAKRDGENLLFVLWPEAKYLINVADRIPEKVVGVLGKIRTDNALAAWDLLRAAIAMPPQYARQLLPVMKQWFEASPERLVNQYVTLIDRFVAAEDPKSALILSELILDVVPGRETSVESLGYRSIDAGSKIGDAHYSWVLQHIVDVVLPADPAKLLQMLTGMLDKALAIENRARGNDLSSIWAADISKKPLGSGAQEALTYAIYDSGNRSVREGRLTLAQVLEIVSAFEWDVLRRIRLRLVADLGTLDDARNALLEPRFYSGQQWEKERGLFLQHFYPQLNDDEKFKVIDGLRTGLTAVDRLEQFFSERCPADEVERAIADARAAELFEELEPIGQFLEGAIAEEFSTLRERFGVKEPGSGHGEVWVGPTAPKTPEELQSMSTSDILSLLETWKPKVGWFQSTPEGLGRALAPIVAARIPEFLAERHRVVTLAPIYVRHIIDAIRPHALSSHFDHAAFLDVLDYARIVDPAKASATYSAWDEADEEPSLAPMRQFAAFAISDMLRANALPVALRSRVWAILSAIIDDTDPTEEHDAQYIGESSFGHPWNLALNSARGAGMLAVFDYARWVRRALFPEGDGVDIYDQVPELFVALDRRLDASVEPTRAVRSTFGQNFTSIYALSRIWTRAAAQRIFSPDPLGDAAWSAYLVFNTVYGETWQLLENHYEQSVLTVSQKREVTSGEWDVAGALGTHLTGPYAWGRIDVRSDSLLDRFVLNAKPSAVRHMLRGVGNALHSHEDIPALALQRFCALFDYVLETYERRPEHERGEVLDVFGLWFFSDILDTSWALTTLARVLGVTGGAIDMDFKVLERLATICGVYPIECARILDRMLDTGEIFHFMNSESVRTILLNAVAAGGAARETAIHINDRLSNTGILHYRDVFQQT